MKNLFSTLLVAAVVAPAAFGATSTLKKTGTFHFMSSDDSPTKVYYASPGCAYGNLKTKKIALPLKNDVLLKFNEKTHWYEVAVKDALPGDNTSFCVYSIDDSKVCEEYDEYTGSCEDYENDPYVMEASLIRAVDFAQYEDLYINRGSKYFKYSDLNIPEIYLNVPEWSGARVEYGWETVTEKDDGWFKIPAELISSLSYFYSFDTTGYEDVIEEVGYYKYKLDECAALVAEMDGNIDENALRKNNCSFYPNILDTVGVEPSNAAGYIRYYVTERFVTPQLEQTGTREALFQDYQYSYDFEYVSYDLSDIVDTTYIDSSDYKWCGADCIYYGVRVRMEVPTYDTIAWDTSYRENSYYARNMPLCGEELKVCDNIVDTLSADSTYYFDELRYELYDLSVLVKVPVLDTLNIDTLVYATLSYTSYETAYDTSYTLDSYYEYDLEYYMDIGYLSLEDIVDTVSIDSSEISKYGRYFTFRIRTIREVREPLSAVFDKSFYFTSSTMSRYVMADGFNVYNNYGYKYFNLKDLTGDKVYIMEDPLEQGKTFVTNVKPRIQILHVLLPSNIKWFSAAPMISFDGGKTGKLLSVDEYRCGWYQMALVSEDQNQEALIYSATNPSLFQGLSEDSDKPFALKDLFAESDTAFLNAIDGTVTLTDPGTEGVCSYTFAGIIYDTDASLNSFFSVYQGVENTPYTEACVGVHQGIVQDTLGVNGKPLLNRGSSAAANCFANSDSVFNTLFNYTEGVNEGSCYNFELGRMKDSRWGYSSDLSVTAGYVGGFYPVENKTDADVFTDPLPAARTKRTADGPTIVSTLPAGIESLDKVCNGPGWTGGIDCDGMFESDDINGVTWNWELGTDGRSRWTGEARNQHFCFESHASFVYQKGLNFTAIGDDDIWVFVAGKLAIDNGGAHLSTPGYIDLDIITDKNGEKLVEGETYDFDLFFCDRRTTMSNMTFKTNMYLTQNSRAELLDPCVVPENQEVFVSSSSTVIPDQSSSSVIPSSSAKATSSSAKAKSSSSSAKATSSSAKATSSSAKAKSSSSSAKATSSSAKATSSSAKATSSSAKAKSSSSSAKATSSSAKATSSSAKATSSSAKAKSSSSSAKATSSSAKAKSSSSSKSKSSSSTKTGIAGVASMPSNFVIMPYGKTLQIAYGRPGAVFTVFDMQGNFVRRGTLGKGVTTVSMPGSGSFIVEIDGNSKLFNIK